jgi:hypothetical protein
MLTMLISGPRQPDNYIDVFLESCICYLMLGSKWRMCPAKRSSP